MAIAQAPPIAGSAPVVVSPGTDHPSTGSRFDVDLAVDLTAVTGSGPAGTQPAALSAFRIPLTFDRTRLQVVELQSGQDPRFAAVGLSATPLAAANASGMLILTATLSSGPAPAGLVYVARLTFETTNTVGAAAIAAHAPTTSLASSIQGGPATLFGPTAIPARASGGGVFIQAPAELRVSVSAGPAPINSGGRLVYSIRAENSGGTNAIGFKVVAPIPANTTFLAASAGGTLVGSTVEWNIDFFEGGQVLEASLAVTVNGAAGTTIAPLTVVASSADTSDAAATSAAVSIVTRPVVKPGSLMTMTSYGGDSGTIYDVTTGTPKPFGRISSAGWAGALLFTPDGTLYATSNAYGGALFDATAGGDLTAAAPIARGLGNRITGIARDASGNIYTSSEQQGAQIRRIAPDGSVTILPPIINSPGGLLVVGTTLYVSEGASGSVRKIDLATNAITTHATGFPPGQHFFSGQLVRTSPANRIFVLWGQNTSNRGLFDITAGGAMGTPVTALNAFRIDINQLATDSANTIYFGGNGTGAVYRATPAAGTAYNATAKFSDGTPESESLAIYPRPAGTLLVLTSTASLAETYVQRELTYTLAFENAGGTSAPGATLTFAVPAGTAFVGASSGGTHVGGVVTWGIGAIASGVAGTRTVTVRTTATAGATLNSTATITGGGSTATTALPPVT
ncbi:MAG TPA: hypothetical protein VFV49_01855, partial [Thermoanaerobaculia bacterium]|nr:hypothetical protein [Thermoanaerobaculia bacterium]